ncbi:TetR family transcriptional regulator [Actinosynnema sp. ALI-1.44]|uniref:TetR/AcrR family transcriptional regulator n=1 Tax=Actinosynnema sp. ALI-1.44 TaxID=1933779 RepID=UPI00097C3940|nr:TetR/AcrR family transcriptional regulator [Actinosynnema sp. ALI-1.44]ONI73051.1 TetR family transcriptional regulator [Actinosynnema sp. ALI-1.44]
MIGAKRRLLTDAVAYMAEHGVADRSLRQIAAGLGTSHRMLIYHFGSKEGLFVAIIKEVEAQQRAVLADLAHEPGESPGDMARRFWRRVSDPSLWPNARLFFEIYGQALQGRPGTAHLLDDVVHAWLDPVIALGLANGLSEEDAAVIARLGLAVTRGLLLDLLATGDRAAVDAAMEHFVVAYEARLPRHS